MNQGDSRDDAHRHRSSQDRHESSQIYNRDDPNQAHTEVDDPGVTMRDDGDDGFSSFRTRQFDWTTEPADDPADDPDDEDCEWTA